MFSAIQGYVADLFSFLFGNVLAISPQDLVALLLLGRGVILVVALLWKELLYATFDPLGAAASGIPVERLEYLFLALVALTIVVSLQAVGIILVVAMLVTPAATAQMLAVRFTRLMAVAARGRHRERGARPVPVYWLDVASGATIVLVQTGLFLVALVLGPRGILGPAARDGASPSRPSRDRGQRAPGRRARRGGLPAHRAAACGRRADRRPRGPLHRRRPRRRRPAPAPRDRAGDDLPDAGRCSPTCGSSSGSTCPTASTPTSRCDAGPSPPRDLHPLRSLPGHRGPGLGAVIAEVGDRAVGSASRPTGWSCSGCAPRAGRPRRATRPARRRRREAGSRAASARAARVLALLVIALATAACGVRSAASSPTPSPDPDAIAVVATTTVLADMVAPGRRHPGRRPQPRAQGRRGPHVRSHPGGRRSDRPRGPHRPQRPRPRRLAGGPGRGRRHRGARAGPRRGPRRRDVPRGRGRTGVGQPARLDERRVRRADTSTGSRPRCGRRPGARRGLSTRGPTPTGPSWRRSTTRSASGSRPIPACGPERGLVPRRASRTSPPPTA